MQLTESSDEFNFKPRLLDSAVRPRVRRQNGVSHCPDSRETPFYPATRANSRAPPSNVRLFCCSHAAFAQECVCAESKRYRMIGSRSLVMLKSRRSKFFSVLPVFAVIVLLVVQATAVPLPFDRSCPVFYDNDEELDQQADCVVMAMASAGKIHLAGMCTTWPDDIGWVPAGYFESAYSNLVHAISVARESGFTGIPDATRGASRLLRKPASGKINDTKAPGSAAAREMVRLSRKASYRKPLVVVVGGPIGTVADAFLLDHSITNKLVVCWFGGCNPSKDNMGEYQGWVDPWAAFIVASKFRLIAIPAGLGSAFPGKAWILANLPDTPLRAWMYNKHFIDVNGVENGPFDGDGDSPCILPLINPNYITRSKTVSINTGVWVTYQGKQMPTYRDDPKGNVTVALSGRGNQFATTVWRREMTNSAAWHRSRITTRKPGAGGRDH